MHIEGMEINGPERDAAHMVATELRFITASTETPHPHRQELLQVTLAFFRLANFGAYPHTALQQAATTIRHYVGNHPEDAVPVVAEYAASHEAMLDDILNHRENAKPAAAKHSRSTAPRR